MAQLAGRRNILSAAILLWLTGGAGAAEIVKAGDFLGKVPILADYIFPGTPFLPYASKEDIARTEELVTIDFHSYPLQDGQVSGAVVRHILRAHFETGTGWQLAGLERHEFPKTVSPLHKLHVFDEAPASLMSVLRRVDADAEGMSLTEVAVLICGVRGLLAHELAQDLDPVYQFLGIGNGNSQVDVDLETASKLVAVYFHGIDARTPEQSLHFAAHVISLDALGRREKRNPFRAPVYTMEDVGALLLLGAQQYALFLQPGCTALQESLAYTAQDGMFPVTSGLPAFLRVQGFDVREDLQYMEAVGAMPKGSGKAWLANYLASPSNCAPELVHVVTCCASQCRPITTQLFQALGGFEADPYSIITAVSNISSRFTEAPRELSPFIVSELTKIANSHGGMVQLHSRWFDIWLHKAFPLECPYPAEIDSKYFKDHEDWMDKINSRDVVQVAAEKQRRYAAAVALGDKVTPIMWGDKEVFYAPARSSSSCFSSLRVAAGMLVMLMVLWSSGRAALEVGGKLVLSDVAPEPPTACVQQDSVPKMVKAPSMV